MKEELEKSTKEEVYNINYENGFNCRYTLKNGKLSTYTFYNKDFSLTYTPKDILEQVKNIHWNELNTLEFPKLSLKELKEFNNFKDLIYIGGGNDGMARYSNGVSISTPFYMDEIFFSCWEHLENTKEYCEKLLKSLKKDWLVESKIVEIPYYNQSDDVPGHYTLWIKVKLPEDIYNEILGKEKYWSNMQKKEVFKRMKKEQ